MSDAAQTPGGENLRGTPVSGTSGLSVAGGGKSQAARVQMMDLNKTFGDARKAERGHGQVTQALARFNLELEPGEMVVLLGPSGCGKTTALRAMTGLQGVDSGKILLDGVDITYRAASKRNMAMVFQQYSLFPHLNAVQNVEFGLRVRKVSATERRRQALEALDLVGLADQAEKYTGQMSGGQQQRVALARALVVRPRVLALDEPLSALDAKVRVNLREEIRRIQKESGITTLFVTHDQEEALAMADRVGVMRAGHLVQLADPQTIYRKPMNEFVATFIGTSNYLPARFAPGQAQVGNQTLQQLPGGPRSGSGQVLVRPENLRLHALDNSHSVPEGQLLAQVTGISFLGATLQVEVRARVAGGEEFPLVVQMAAGGAEGLQVGGTCRVEVESGPVLGLSQE